MKKRLIKSTCLTLTVVAIVGCCLACFVGCFANDYVADTAKNLNEYVLECGYDEEARSLSAIMTFEYTNDTGKAVEKLPFHLYPNAYREDANAKVVGSSKVTKAYPNGYDYGGITVQYAKQGEQNIAFEICGEDENILALPLCETLEQGKKTTVEICFETHLANVLHRLGYGDNTVNLNHWFPLLCKYDVASGEWLQDSYCHVGDPFVSDVANFCVGLTVDESFVVASTGTEVCNSVSQDGGGKRYCFEARAVRDFSIVMSQKYERVETAVGKTKLIYYFFDDESPQDILNLAKSATEYFGQSFGEYPYETLSVCQSDFCEGGMEYPRLVMVAHGLTENFCKKAVVHEIAHQWWCCLVGNDQIRNAWMDEGLAEYSTHLFFEERDFGIDANAEMRLSKQSLHNFLEITKNYFNQVDTSLNRSVKEYRNESEYAYLNYTKAMIMFDDFRRLMGKTKFLKSLKLYFKNCRLTVATPADMAKAFSVGYGTNMTQLFDEVLSGKETTIVDK